MAKSKSDLFADAQTAGAVAADANPDDFTVDELRGLLTPERAAWEGSLSSKVPIVAPDGHVTLSQEDIDRANA